MIISAFPLAYVLWRASLVLHASRGLKWWHRVLLESSPFYEHHDLKQGLKPATRFHWMHHLLVPKGTGPTGDEKNVPNTAFYDALMEFFWFGIYFKWLNSSSQCVDYYDYDPEEPKFIMFPIKEFPLREEKEPPKPEYIFNKQIKRIKKMKEQQFKENRKKWILQQIEHTKTVVPGFGPGGDVEDMDDKKIKHIETSLLTDKEHCTGHEEPIGSGTDEDSEHSFEGYISDGESFDDLESEDWNDLSGDESDDETLAILAMAAGADNDDTLSRPSLLFRNRRGSMLKSKALGLKNRKDRSSYEIEAHEEEREFKADMEFRYDDIDDEQEAWEESSEWEESESDTETDITDENLRSEDEASPSETHIRFDAIYTDSSEEGGLGLKSHQPSGEKLVKDPENMEDDSWSDENDEVSDEEMSSGESSVASLHNLTLRKRRNSFISQVQMLEMLDSEDEEEEQKHKHKKEHKKKKKHQEVEKEEDNLSGPFRNKSFMGKLKDMRKRIVSTVKNRLQNLVTVGRRSGFVHANQVLPNQKRWGRKKWHQYQ